MVDIQAKKKHFSPGQHVIFGNIYSRKSLNLTMGRVFLRPPHIQYTVYYKGIKKGFSANESILLSLNMDLIVGYLIHPSY